MSEHLPHRLNKGIRVIPHQSCGLLESMCMVSCQVNLLALLSAVFVTTGFLTHFFHAQPIADKTIAVGSLVALCAVIGLNAARKNQLANVVFYVSFNMISLVTFRDLPGQPVEAILMYLFLLSLVVFLFQQMSTRLICMSIVLFRIIFFEINAKYIIHADGIVYGTANEEARLIFDGMLLSLIIVVFVLYGIKIYTVESLQKKNALFGQHMSHDLQVSYHAVASIITHLKYASDSKRIKSSDTTLINELANASGFFTYILNNFLEFSRFERGQIESNHYEEIDLASELENIVELYKYMANEKGIHIVLVLDDQLPGFILSDKIKVTRIVLNLLTNAIKNTARGNTITIGVRWMNGPWELSVANEGGELRSEEIRQLFTPYESGETTTGKRRLGLGLPITKELVEALGGSITATSQKDYQTLFTVAFPVE